MPGELTPSEYYQCFRASQRRVGQWVQDTNRHMPFAAADAPEIPTEQGSLAIPGALENAQSAGSSTRGDSTSKNSSFYAERRKAAIAVVDKTHEEDVAGREHDHRSRRSSSRHRRSARDVDHDPSAHSYSRTRQSSSTKKSKTSSLRPENTSRGAPTATTGKPSTGSSSRDKDRHRSSRHSHSQSHRTRTHRDKHDRGSSRSKSTPVEIISLLPYGILPLLFAMTGGSSVVSFAAAGLMLVGYLVVDYTTLRPSSKSRR